MMSAIPGKRKIEQRDPFLQRHLQLEIYFRDSGERLTKNSNVESEQDRDPKPKKQKKRDDVFRPPVAVLVHSVRPAQCLRNSRNENGAEINAEHDADVSEHSSGPGQNHACDLRVENVLHFRIGRKKTS